MNVYPNNTPNRFKSAHSRPCTTRELLTNNKHTEIGHMSHSTRGPKVGTCFRCVSFLVFLYGVVYHWHGFAVSEMKKGLKLIKPR